MCCCFFFTQLLQVYSLCGDVIMPGQIICHFFSSLCFLLLIFLRTVTSFEVQNMLADQIGGGEARFYTVESKELVIIALISDSGDADMYASTTSKNSHPSPEDYEFMSTSCGLDVMVLDTSRDKSKMTVGVYGHVRYDKSSYRVYIISPSQEDIKRYQVCIHYIPYSRKYWQSLNLAVCPQTVYSRI